MRSPAERRKVWTLFLTALVLIAGWWITQQQGEDGSDGRASERTHQTAPDTRSEADRSDPDSGLPFVEVDDLPDEAAETIALIEQGGPFPYPCCDDTTFRNDEGLLPDHPRGYYREYTVDTPGSSHRGARRIVVGDQGEFYWTADHYESFERIEMDHDGALP